MHKNKKANGPNLESSPQGTRASQPIDKAKIQINSESAISKLENLKTKYANSKNFKGLLTDLRVACGIPNDENPSKYGTIQIPDNKGDNLYFSLRLSNHHTNASTYIDNDANYLYNLSIVIKRRGLKDRFIPNEHVSLEEFAYTESNTKNVESPICKIIDGLISYIRTGNYIDYTKNAFYNQSPISEYTKHSNSILSEHTIYNKNNNKRNNMKRTIRLTESDLRRLVEGALNELDWKTYANAADKARRRGEMDRSRRLYDKTVDSFNNKEYYDDNGNPYDRNLTLDKVSIDNLEPWVGSEWHFNKYSKDNRLPDVQDFDDYHTKNAIYEPGHGWVRDFDESRNRNLVNRITESIIRRLKR